MPIRRLLTAAETPRPLIIGSSVVLSDDQELVIVGGAATCFSMGTFCMYRTRRPSLLSLTIVH